jgi:intracellular multiplication protein IcmK
MSKNLCRSAAGGVLAVALISVAAAQSPPSPTQRGAEGRDQSLPAEMMMLVPPRPSGSAPSQRLSEPASGAAVRSAPVAQSPSMAPPPVRVPPQDNFAPAPPAAAPSATPSEDLQIPAPSQAPPRGQPLQIQGDDAAFRAALQGLLPMTPDMIRSFSGHIEDVRRAAVRPAPGAGVPVTRSVSLNLRPGEALPRVNLAAGNVSALVFADQTGAPWPVQSVTVANSDAYQAVEAGERGKTNMVVISPKQHFAAANNLIVTLVNHPVPIVFGLDTGTSSVDYRVDVTLRARGPNAAPEVAIGGGLAPTDDALLRAFADGTPPRGARPLQASRQDIDIWRHNDMLYVRTPLQMLSPAWVGYMAHPTGVRVYTIPDGGRASLPVLYVSADGRSQFVTVTERRGR